MLRTYKVGGYRFCVSMSDDSALWKGMDNYNPFMVDSNAGLCNAEISDLLFRLDIDFSSNGDDIVRDSKHLAEFDDDTAYISLMSGPDNQRIFLISLNSAMKEQGGILAVERNNQECKLYLGACNDYRHGLFIVNNALMLLYALMSSVKDTILIHASVVMADGYGFAFLGKSGTGKSTHTRLWLQNIPGTSLLNDDNPVVRIDSSGNPVIYGSPWSGKTPCYKNLAFPVGGMVRLYQASVNRFTVQKNVDAFITLYPGCSVISNDALLSDGLFDTLAQLAEKVPVGIMECLPNKEAALLCCHELKHNTMNKTQIQTI